MEKTKKICSLCEYVVENRSSRISIHIDDDSLLINIAVYKLILLLRFGNRDTFQVSYLEIL